MEQTLTTMPDQATPDQAAVDLDAAAARVQDAEAKLDALRSRLADAERAAGDAERAFIDGADDQADGLTDDGDAFAQLDAKARALRSAVARAEAQLADAKAVHADALAALAYDAALDDMADAALDAWTARTELDAGLADAGAAFVAFVNALAGVSTRYQAGCRRFHQAGIAAGLPDDGSASREVVHRAGGLVSVTTEPDPSVLAVLDAVASRLPADVQADALAAAQVGHRLNPGGRLLAAERNRALWTLDRDADPFAALAADAEGRGDAARFAVAIVAALSDRLLGKAPTLPAGPNAAAGPAKDW